MSLCGKQLLIVDEDDGGRIDSYIAEKIETLSRSTVQKLIESGNILLNARSVKAKTAVSCGDEIEITVPKPQKTDIEPENIPVSVVYEDEYIAVINKPQGLTVHPANGVYSGTLVNALLYRIKNLSSIGGVIRPGIVHRIDKDTSGLLVVAKCDSAHLSLSKQIAEKTCRRIYRAINEGIIKQDTGEIIAPIGRSLTDRKKMAVVTGGRYAETHYRVLERFKENTYTEFELKTGRTHQIRVHCAYIKHPVTGDLTYGYQKQKFALNGQLLHAYRLILKHPQTGSEMEFEAPLPDYFQKILNILK